MRRFIVITGDTKENIEKQYKELKLYPHVGIDYLDGTCHCQEYYNTLIHYVKASSNIDGYVMVIKCFTDMPLRSLMCLINDYDEDYTIKSSELEYYINDEEKGTRKYLFNDEAEIINYKDYGYFVPTMSKSIRWTE